MIITDKNKIRFTVTNDNKAWIRQLITEQVFNADTTTSSRNPQQSETKGS